ncbi:MAG: chemotaxis protein CheV [Phycisphaerae bacterium]|nr:chemotaxis protein CheV [Phycisphaerae bacterium]
MKGQPVEKQKILLESGTNELEVLVFSVGPTRYGVNVAKVREVIGKVDPVPVPMANQAVSGVFKLRETVAPLVDLQLYFEPGVPSASAHRSVIFMEFNNLKIGFLVDAVERIYRVSWENVKPLPLGQAKTTSIITSVCEINEGLVLMVDFEKITFDITSGGDAFRSAGKGTPAASANRATQNILLAEDSPTIRKAIFDHLVTGGYGSVTAVGNGQEAWDRLQQTLSTSGAKPYTVVVTDIEMPQMDGLHLCKRIKDHPDLKQLPIVVFSSLISDDNLKKCLAVGATAALTKPQMTRLVETLDDLLLAQGILALEDDTESEPEPEPELVGSA